MRYKVLALALVARGKNDGNANSRPGFKAKFYTTGSGCLGHEHYLGQEVGDVGNCTPARGVLGGAPGIYGGDLVDWTRTINIEECTCTETTFSIHNETGTKCLASTELDRRTVPILGEDGSTCVPGLDLIVLCPGAYWDGNCATSSKSKSSSLSWVHIVVLVALHLVGLAFILLGGALAHRCFVRHVTKPKLPPRMEPVECDDTVFLDDLDPV